MTLRRALGLIALQMLLVFGIGFGLLAPLAQAGSKDRFAPTPAAFGFVVLFGVISAVGLVGFGSVRQPGRTWSELGWRWDAPARHVAVGLVAALACIAGEVAVLLALGHSLSEIAAAIADATFARRALFLVIGLQAGFCEESLFRGNLFDALRAKLPVVAAVLVGAVVFALYHLQVNPIGLVVKIWFGVVFTVARLRGRSLVSPAIAHAMVWCVMGDL